jgi:hypothetical protein
MLHSSLSVTERFAVVVLEDLEALGGLEISIVERMEAHAAVSASSRSSSIIFLLI